MRKLLTVLGVCGFALAAVIAFVALARQSGVILVWAGGLVLPAAICMGIAVLLERVERIEAQLGTRDHAAVGRMREAVATGGAQAPAVAGHELPEAAAAKLLLKQAETLHFSKRFTEAVATYERVVAQFPDTAAASAAQRQIANLKR